MRASYITAPENMTAFGNWIACRLPHGQITKGCWGHKENLVVRAFGFRPLYRFCFFDFTRMKKYTNKPPVTRLRILGLTVWDRIN